MNWLKKHFPTHGEKNVFLFYMVSIFGHTWFQIANWLLFVVLFVSEGEFAWYEAVAFGAGILLEIPSGAIADLLGRRKTLILAYSMQVCGSIIFLLADFGAAMLFIGNLIIISSFALQSGSLEALVYDSLLQKKKEKYYDEVLSKGLSLTLLSIVVAAAIGGFAWQYSVYAPWSLSLVGFIVALLFSVKFTEPEIDSEIFTLENFIKQNKRGFYYLFKSDFRKYTFSMAILAGTFLMWEEGIIRVLMGTEFNYDGASLSYLVSATLLVSFLATFTFKRIRKLLGDLIGYGSLVLMAAVAWLLSGLFLGDMLIGAIVFFAITLSGSLAELWNSVILNKHVQSKDRATAISTLSFLIQVPYVLVVVFYGYLFESGNTKPFYILTGLALLVAFILFVRAEKSRVLVKK